ncbi:MAG: response regulator [Gemmatimonadaceae bacterium]|nr:response regulator [Gemmatimonadaceae bacterium]
MTSISTAARPETAASASSGSGVIAPLPPGGRAWIGVGVYATLLIVWTWLNGGGRTVFDSAVGTMAFLPLNVAAAYFLFRASTNSTYDTGERRGFRLLAGMYVLTAVGNFWWSVEEALFALDPAYSWANLFYIASYIAGMLAVRRFPADSHGVDQTRKRILDVASVVISLSVLTWTFVLEPIRWDATDPLHLAVRLSYPASCILLMAFMARLVLRQATNERYNDISVIAVAVMVQCTLDLILELDYSNQVTQLTSIAAAICPGVYVAVVWASQRAVHRTERAVDRRDGISLIPVSLLPTISSVSVYIVLIWAAQSDRREPLGILVVAALTLNLLFLLRQTIAVRENALMVAQRADAESRARYEERAREGQKLEAVGRLAGGIAHDFNNLLTTVLANSDFALTRLRPGDVAHDEVSDIRSAAVRGSELIRQLLAFSRKSVSAPVRLHPDLVLREIERLLQRLAGDDCRLLLDLPPHLGMITADRGQLEQVIANLVTNARDAMPAGGPILISGRNVALEEPTASSLVLPPGEYVALSVSDTGVGIAADVRGHIFEPFFSTKPRGKGTGLGLASSYGIIRQGNGGIEVESEPGKGSRFTLYLPRVAGEPASHLPSAVTVPTVTESQPARTETILLVEDETAVRQVARRMLLAEGYHVFTAGDANAARAQFALHGDGIDLMVTDIMMPGESGIELAAYIRQRWPQVAVLFISGYSDAELPDGSRAGVRDNLVQKPFTSAELLKRIDGALERRRTAAVP